MIIVSDALGGGLFQMNVKELFDLTGRVAVVTGGGTGIGRQMAEGLAEAGANTAICSRKAEVCKKTADEIRDKLRVQTLGLEVDITDPESIDAMAQRVAKEFGKIDILVNNSGIAWAEPPEKTSIENWKRVIESNLTGTFISCQRIGRLMIDRHYGKIINISSVAGFMGSPTEMLDAISYSASKGGIMALTKDLAAKWAKYNITVNALAPSYFHTHMTDWIIRHRSEQIISRTPLRRLGADDDLKGPVVFLASESSKFLTGQILFVDGGLTSSF